jgi:hypothetical protein
MTIRSRFRHRVRWENHVSEHGDVREALELAAVEPGGLDRLEAGDAPGSAVIAGHLAGCPACLEELARLRRADALLRPILAAEPDPALRERTLGLVRAVGVPRGAGSTPVTTVPRRRFTTPAWIGAVAAALVVGLVGGSLLAGAWMPAGKADPATALAAVARETAALIGAGDARQVALLDGAGAAGGTLVLSPSADRIVVTAAGLPAPSAGAEYRCWVEIDGVRTALGTMWRAGDVAWWSGDVPLPADLPAGVAYGVSLVEAGASGVGTVVLAGEL